MNTLELIFFVPIPLLLTALIKPLFMNVFKFRSKDERTVIVCANIVSLIITALIAALLVNIVDELIPMVLGGFLLMCLLEFFFYRLAFGKVKALFVKIMLSNLVTGAVLVLYFMLFTFLA